MKRFLLNLGILFVSLSAHSQNCIDVGVALDRQFNQLIFSNVLLAGERFLAYDGAGRTGYPVTTFSQFRVCNGFYKYFNSPCDAYTANDIHGTYWAYYNNKWNGHIDHYDLMVKNKLIDSKGYPKSIPMTMKSADSTFDVEVLFLRRQLNLPANYPKGDYSKPWVFRWKGKGEVEIGSTVTSVFNKTSNVSGALYFVSTGGQVRMEIELNGATKLDLRITKSDPSDPIRDMELLFPGTETLYDGGNHINPEFMDKMKNFKMIRFKECLGATTYKESGGGETDPTFINWIHQINWNERVTPEWYWQNGRRGMALDYVIEICNQAKINPWVSIPYCASQEYCNNAAKLFMQKLSPDLIAYFELGSNMLFWRADGEYGGNNGFYFMEQMAKTYYGGLGSIEATGAYLNDMFQAMGDGAGPCLLYTSNYF